jgi:protein-histidine pros-kinase
MHLGFRSGYVSDPHTRPMGFAGDLYARRRDGSEFPVEISLAPLESQDGLLVSAAVRDITERRLLHEREEINRAKDEFFSTVSHELRTPLTSVLGYSEMMAELPLDPQAEKFRSVIARNAQRELRLVDDLLTLASIEKLGMQIHSSVLDLGPVVSDAVDAAQPAAPEAQRVGRGGRRPNWPGDRQPHLQRPEVHPCQRECGRQPQVRPSFRSRRGR